MSKITFIRHAEPISGKEILSECKVLTRDGVQSALDMIVPPADYIITSTMPRAVQTAYCLYDKNILQYKSFCEYEPQKETEEGFISRVIMQIESLKKRAETQDLVVVSHSYFMNVAYQLLFPEKKVIGFKYLEGFTYEGADNRH